MLSACYTINLRPPLYLRNALPIDIQVSVAGCTVQADSQSGEQIKEQNAIEKRTHENLIKADFLDYGEKVVKPGDLLHLPTVKTTAKEGEHRSYLVARVRTKISINSQSINFNQEKNPCI